MSPTMKTLALLPVAVALLAGCSSSDDDTPDTNQTSMPSGNPGENPTVLTKFDGTYLAACAPGGGEPSQGSFVETTTISGDTGSASTLSYTDAACTTPDIPAETVYEFSVAYPGETVETARGTADAINITVENVTLDGQPPTAERMAEFSNAGTFDVRYDIALLDGSELYLGDNDGELDGTSEANRPATLDPVAAIRQ